MGLIKTAAAGAIGYALYKYVTRNTEPATASGPVRDAGPANMTTPPASWSATDEALDETFPASDATAKY